METPQTLFRCPDGTVFEDMKEAHENSVREAIRRFKSHVCSKQSSAVDDGDSLVDNEDTIIKAMVKITGKISFEANQFLTKVQDLKVVPINHKDYEQSQNGILREIWRYQRIRRKAKKPETIEGLKLKIKRLKAIEKSLQEALEKY
jgi:hypothetical protein